MAFPSREQPIAWVLTTDAHQGERLGRGLNDKGWHIGRVNRGVREAAVALQRGLAPPDLVVCELQFRDGDVLQLMRLLRERALTPALFLLTQQQRAVVKAAQALAHACQLHVVGEAGSVEDAVQAIRPVNNGVAWPSLAPRPEPRPLSLGEVRQLVDRRALHAYLQPKLLLATNQVVGFECLMRGIDPEGKLISPDRLIEPLQRARRLAGATLQLVNQAVVFVTQCRRHGLAIGASVNVPLSLMSDRTFCHELSDLVLLAGLDPALLTIEITETEAMEDFATVIENTARIRMMGFNLSIDDFGSAYSSLTQLSQIPFSELKIEKEFVRQIDSDATKFAIVSGCARLANTLDLHIVAEGVETPQQLACVREAGCTQAQGYLLSPPMPSGDAFSWLQSLGADHLPPPVG